MLLNVCFFFKQNFNKVKSKFGFATRYWNEHRVELLLSKKEREKETDKEKLALFLYETDVIEKKEHLDY